MCWNLYMLILAKTRWSSDILYTIIHKSSFIFFVYIHIGAAVYQWCGFKSLRGKNKNLTALISNSNTVWFNFQTYIYTHIYSYLFLIRWSISWSPISNLNLVGLCHKHFNKLVLKSFYKNIFYMIKSKKCYAIFH